MSSPVSVIIPCHNAAPWVPTQIAAVSAQLAKDDELIVVDNRSTDGTPDILRTAQSADPRVRVVEAPSRPGANYARNVGIRAARNPVLLFCDADDVVQPGWVDALRAALQAGGIVGGTAVPVDSQGAQVGEVLGLHEIYGGPPYPIGASMGVHRDLLETIGGFDESFRGGHDETDLAWRAAAAGWITRLVPEARVSSLQRAGAGEVVRQRRSYARTAIQLWSRHPQTADPHGVSLRAAARGILQTLPLAFRARAGRASLAEAAAWGWSLGTLEGHLRYRVLGRPPAPAIPSIPSRSSS